MFRRPFEPRQAAIFSALVMVFAPAAALVIRALDGLTAKNRLEILPSPTVMSDARR